MERIKELDMVVLTRSLPEFGLEPGDIGVIVHLYRDQKAVEVEFVMGDGGTVAVVTLQPSDVRVLQKGEILHARQLAA